MAVCISRWQALRQASIPQRSDTISVRWTKRFALLIATSAAAYGIYLSRVSASVRNGTPWFIGAFATLVVSAVRNYLVSRPLDITFKSELSQPASAEAGQKCFSEPQTILSSNFGFFLDKITERTWPTIQAQIDNEVKPLLTRCFSKIPGAEITTSQEGYYLGNTQNNCFSSFCKFIVTVQGQTQTINCTIISSVEQSKIVFGCPSIDTNVLTIFEAAILVGQQNSNLPKDFWNSIQFSGKYLNPQSMSVQDFCKFFTVPLFRLFGPVDQQKEVPLNGKTKWILTPTNHTHELILNAETSDDQPRAFAIDLSARERPAASSERPLQPARSLTVVMPNLAELRVPSRADGVPEFLRTLSQKIEIQLPNRALASSGTLAQASGPDFDDRLRELTHSSLRNICQKQLLDRLPKPGDSRIWTMTNIASTDGVGLSNQNFTATVCLRSNSTNLVSVEKPVANITLTESVDEYGNRIIQFTGSAAE